MCFNICFCFLAGNPLGILSSAEELKICPVTAGIKKYKSLIKKEKNKYGKIALSTKAKLNTIEILINFNKFLVIFKYLGKLIKSLHEDLKESQKKVLKLNLHQTIVLL